MFSDRRILTSLVAIATDFVLTAIKLALAMYTGSAALRADAFHSATDLVVSIVLLVGIVYRIFQERKTSDNNVSSGRMVESALAIFVALIILYVPYEIISDIGSSASREVENLAVGIAGIVVVILVVLFISRFKLFVGRETQSIALEADGYHSMIDVFTSIAVLVSLVGLMVGINLDELIAVVIAIMITVTGLELLFSGFNALINKTDFDQLNFYEFAVGRVSLLYAKIGFQAHVQNVIAFTFKFKYLYLAVFIGIYLCSGMKVIENGSVGKKYVFGEGVGSILEPGLHYVAPWPFGELATYQQGYVYDVNVGTRSTELFETERRLWLEMKFKSQLEETADYFMTADAQLVDLTVSVLYRVNDAALFSANVLSHDALVRDFARFSLSQFVLEKNLNELFSTRRKELESKLKLSLQHELDEVGEYIDVIELRFQTFRPPALVIGAYRDVINAQQEKQQAINRAIADRSTDLPLSRAVYEETTSLAESQSIASLLEAEGQIAKITELAKVQAEHENGFEFNTYMTMVESALDNKEITIKDHRLSNSDLRLWLQQ